MQFHELFWWCGARKNFPSNHISMQIDRIFFGQFGLMMKIFFCQITSSCNLTDYFCCCRYVSPNWSSWLRDVAKVGNLQKSHLFLGLWWLEKSNVIQSAAETLDIKKNVSEMNTAHICFCSAGWPLMFYRELTRDFTELFINHNAKTIMRTKRATFA